MTTAENILSPRALAPVASAPRRAASSALNALAPTPTARAAWQVWWTGLAAAVAWGLLGAMCISVALAIWLEQKYN